MHTPRKGDYKYFQEVGYQQKIKAQEKELDAFRSGEKYRRMEAEKEKQQKQHEQEIRKLKKSYAKEIAELKAENRQLRRILDELGEDCLKDIEETKTEADKKVRQLTEKLHTKDEQLKKSRERQQEHAKAKYTAERKAMDWQAEAERLNRLLTMDHTVSNLPSSVHKHNPLHQRKKIENNRKSTGAKPGAQCGHQPHPRRTYDEPDTIIRIADDELRNDPRYYPTGRIIRKQLVQLELVPRVTQFETAEYRSRETGARKHAAFPHGLQDEVEYGETVKAFILYLTFQCNIAAEKAAQLIQDVSHQKLKVSHGFITGLLEEFSIKTAKDRDEIWKQLANAKAAGIDSSSVDLNGRNYPISVFVNDDYVWFQATPRKGKMTVANMPAREFTGIRVADDEPAFEHVGTEQQDCLVHKTRKLKAAIEDDKDRTWFQKMLSFLQKLIHARKSWGPDGPLPAEVKTWKEEYDDIVMCAEKEYAYDPPAKYCMTGFNLYKNFRDDKKKILLFLDYPQIDPDNNRSERMLRKGRIKENVAINFRSEHYVHYFAHYLTYAQTMILRKENLYEKMLQVFVRSGRKKYTHKQKEAMLSSLIIPS